MPVELNDTRKLNADTAMLSHKPSSVMQLLQHLWAACPLQLCMHLQSGPDLLCRAVRDVSTLPKAVHTDLLELGSWRVGVEALPGVQDHFAGG